MNEAGACSIYKVRPSACRTYFSYGDPLDCENKTYPTGTVEFRCAEKNIYISPLSHLVKEEYGDDQESLEQKKKKFFVFYHLLPLQFLKKMEDGCIVSSNILESKEQILEILSSKNHRRGDCHEIK